MATLQASRVLEALKKAKQVGRVEEPVTIAGCPLVLQNLSPDDYDSIHDETKDLDELEYLHAYQIAHVCRAIIEIGDQDLRDVQYIEDEVPSGAWGIAAYLPSKKTAEELAAEVKKLGGKATVIKPDGEVRTIKLERHEWLRNFVAGWGREAVQVGWRKVMDVVATADEKAKEGVQFKIPDETNDDKFRRLLGELKEVEEELPDELVQSALAEMGYQSISTTAELQAVDDKLQKLREAAPEPEEAQQGLREAARAPSESGVTPTIPKPSSGLQSPPEAQEQPSSPRQVDPAELMRGRKRLNENMNQVPTPSVTVQPATRPAPVPQQLRQAAEANVAPLRGRAAEIAALEAQVDPTIIEEASIQPRQPYIEEVAELSERAEGIDGAALKASVDRPPMVGINPRFKPPPGMGPTRR
jgi:hypothetical protein